jgi:hypothetical protein
VRRNEIALGIYTKIMTPPSTPVCVGIDTQWEKGAGKDDDKGKTLARRELVVPNV